MHKTIALLTDIHLDEESTIHNGVDPRAQWQLLVKDVENKNVDEIVFAGDIGAPSAYPWFFNTLKETSICCHVILGNHDVAAEALKYAEQNCPSANELYYACEDEIYLYLFMDTSSTIVSDEQLDWLSKQINTPKKIVIFIHHPILKVESMVDELYPLQNRDAVKALLQKIPNPVTIFSGHYHATDERSDNNIRQILSPAASFQIPKKTKEIEIDNSVYGYRIIEITDDSISSDVIMHHR